MTDSEREAAKAGRAELAGLAVAGPLVVSTVNPRYFAVASDPHKAVYLTGSHIWNNFHDGMGPGAECGETAEPLDFGEHLDFLEERGHNFIRLWRWEHFKSQAAGGEFHLCMTPQPWPRTGPGVATDGKARFNLDTFDEAFFERLRERVIAAGERGMYVAVMLFDGWALHLSPAPDHVEGHPFHAENNVNGIAIGSIADYQVLPLDPRVQALQEAYVRKVLDTLHDLPNLLWEVANESSGGGQAGPEFNEALGLAEIPDWGDSTSWQYWVIDTVKRHEQQMGYEPHPIGMTMQFPVAEQTKVNDPLYASRAEWISPGYDDEVFAGGGHPMAPGSQQSRWLEDPPPADGPKVVITDTDHYAPGRGDALWAWKSFVRGHHPILMDYGLIAGVHSPDPAFEPARYAMGDTLRFATRMNLIAMEPRGELSSTGYVLASPGAEYLVLDPSNPPGAFTVHLEPGTYVAEWFAIDSRGTVAGEQITVETPATTSFTSPAGASGPNLLYLHNVERHGSDRTDEHDLAAIARSIVDTNQFMALGTADASGTPWVCPVWYAPMSYRDYVWVSRPGTRHSRNLAERPQVAITIYHARQPSSWSAVYMAAVAQELDDVDDALDAFNRRSEAQGLRAWSRAEVVPPGEFRLYRATATEQFVLDDHDARLPVHLS